MATFTGNGTGSNMYGYMHARVYVTRTDNSDGTTCSVKVDCYAISDGGSSSFISGRVSKNEACSLWSDYSSEKSLSSGGTTFMTSFTFTVNRAKTTKTITCKAQIHGGGTGMYNGLTDTASVSVTIPALATYTVSYNANKPNVTASVQGMPAAQTKYHGIGLTLSTNQPSLTNYIFKGWAGDASGSVLIQPGESYTYIKNENKTYYAKWELAYKKPEISNLTIFRTATSDGTTNNEDGEYMYVSFSWAQDSSITGTNAPTIKIGARVKGSSSNYTTCKTETSTSGTSGTYATTVGFGSATFAKMSSYDIQITITDNRSSKPSGNDGITSVNGTLSQSYVLLDFSPNGIGMGVTAPEIKQLELGIGFKHSGDSVLLESLAKTAWINALGLGVEVIADNGELIVFRCGPVIMIQIRGVTASVGTVIGDGTCANYKPKQNASAILGTFGGTSDSKEHYCRCWVSAQNGSIALEQVDYSGSGKWYGTLTYITSAPVWNSTEIDPVTVTMLTPRVLYSSTPPTDAGNTGPLTITLNESAANYNYMRIYYSDRVGNSKSVDIYQPQGKKVALDIINGSDLDTADASRMIWLKGSRWSIDGTSITKIAEVTHDLLNIPTANTHAHNITKTQHIFIWRVEAWGPVL